MKLERSKRSKKSQEPYEHHRLAARVSHTRPPKYIGTHDAKTSVQSQEFVEARAERNISHLAGLSGQSMRLRRDSLRSYNAFVLESAGDDFIRKLYRAQIDTGH